LRLLVCEFPVSFIYTIQSITCLPKVAANNPLLAPQVATRQQLVQI
jgi:hypothetical protein